MSHSENRLRASQEGPLPHDKEKSNTTEQVIGEGKLGIISNEEDGCYWLIIAAKQGHIKRVQKYVAHGVDINATDKNGSTALIEASSEGHVEIVNFLLTNGANIDQADKHELTALMCACMSGHANVACTLIQADADLNLTDMSGMTALDLALENNHLELLQAIVALGINIGCINQARETKQDNNLSTKSATKLSWLGQVLTRRCISPTLVRLCEEKLVHQEGFGSPLTLTRTSDKHFNREYLNSLGITGLGLCEILLTLQSDLHTDLERQLNLHSGVDRGGGETAARAAVKAVLGEYLKDTAKSENGLEDADWGVVSEVIPNNRQCGLNEISA